MPPIALAPLRTDGGPDNNLHHLGSGVRTLRRPRAINPSAVSCTVVHPDIRPDNPPERASHYIDVPNIPWESTKFPGIRIKVLYSDDSGITTALFKLEPGAVVPLHEHVALEQTYVIEGTLEDHEGICGPDQFVWRPAGNQHEAVAPNGAVILGFFLKPNRFAYGEKFFTEAAGQPR
jgi:quercetin dioxygenase-like cupin family protein